MSGSRARPAGGGPAGRAGAGAGSGAGWSGLLPVDKPTGVTSHDVVDHARRRLGVGAIGHLGTLDPAASGLLVLALGAATRCALVWQGGQKTYVGTARFGVVTDSQDLEGRTLARSDARPTEADVRAAATAMLGELDQVPPMVSALKHGGERLYALARRGITVERPARRIRVDAWRWLELAPESDARFEVTCSAGTYVRTLVHDLGTRLGCGAALASLRRTRSEPFTLEQACAWESLDREPPAELLASAGIPLDRALETLPAVVLDEAAAASLGLGQAPRVEPGGGPVGAGPRSVVFRDASGRALAIGGLERGSDGVRARPAAVFRWAVRTGRPA